MYRIACNTTLAKQRPLNGLMQAMHGCAKRGGGMGRARTRSSGTGMALCRHAKRRQNQHKRPRVPLALLLTEPPQPGSQSRLCLLWRRPGPRCSPSADQPPRGRVCPLLLRSTSVPACLGTDKRSVDEVLGEEPRLEFSRADDIRDNQVVGAVVPERSDSACCIVRVAEDHLVRLEQPG